MVWDFFKWRSWLWRWPWPCKFRWRKKEIPTTTSIDSLSDELLFSILVGLPADHLHDRARLVCRRWCDIIRSKSFINAHIQLSKYCLLCYYDYSDGRPSCMMAATSQGLIQTSDFSCICRERFVGSCNGLVLKILSRENNTTILQIINPATKQALVLPPFSVDPATKQHHIRCGIGYAAASMVYKVAISYRTDSPTTGLAILSVGVDNSWRQVQVDQYLSEQHATTLLCDGPPFHTEGFIHWVQQRSGEMVVTLNVETEILTVSEVPSPPEKDEECFKPKFYLTTGRSLSVLIGQCGLYGKYKHFFELWEMNQETKEWMMLVDDIKFGSQQQMQRLKQLGFMPGVYLRPHGWLKYPEVLVFTEFCSTKSRAIISYNLDTQEINSTEFPMQATPNTRAMYKNSLVWLT